MILDADTQRVLKAVMKRPELCTLEIAISYTYDKNHKRAHAGLQFFANTQAQVAEHRRRFPGAFWTKQYNEACNWWQYEAVVRIPKGFGRYERVPVKIVGVTEAPPTCQMTEIEVMEEQYVPVDDAGNPLPKRDDVRYGFAKVPVRKRKYICGGADPATTPLPADENPLTPGAASDTVAHTNGTDIPF